MFVDEPPTPAPGPSHVAIIMDGNGRWATSWGLPRLAGHKRGADRVREIVEACPKLGVTHLTLFAFSTENWSRPAAEVSGLMRLFRRYIKKEGARLVAEGARVRFIGGRERLESDLQALMGGLEMQTRDNDRLHLTVAINYGGRDEILRATRRIAEAVRAGQLRAEDITSDTMSDYLDTAGLPDPDLISGPPEKCAYRASSRGSPPIRSSLSSIPGGRTSRPTSSRSKSRASARAKGGSAPWHGDSPAPGPLRGSWTARSLGSGACPRRPAQPVGGGTGRSPSSWYSMC